MKHTLSSQELLTYARSKPAMDLAAVLAANIIAALATFAVMAIASRTLGAAQFGIFSVLVALSIVVVGATDFGLGTGVVRFAAPLLSGQQNKAARLFKAIFLIKATIGLSILLLGNLVAPWISSLLFKTVDYAGLVRIALATAGLLSFGAFFPAFFQAQQRFITFGLWSVLPAAARLIAILYLLTQDKLNLLSMSWTYLVVAFGAVLLALLITSRQYLPVRLVGVSHDLCALFRFVKWVLLSFVVTSLLSRTDLLMLPYYLPAGDVGVYSVGAQLTTGFQLITLALSSVLLPWVSRLPDTNLINAAKLLAKGGIVLAILLIPVLVAAPMLISLFFGSNYAVATPAFRVLGVSFLIAMISVPLSLFFYRLHKPQTLFAINALQLAIVVSANLYAIPRWHIVGPAYSYLAASIIGVTLTAFLLQRAFKSV